MIINQRNQTFSVFPENDREKNLIKRWLKNLATFKMVRVKGKSKWVVGDEYFLYLLSTGTYIFLDTYIKEFIYVVVSALPIKDVTSKLTEIPRVPGVRFRYKSKFKPRDEQSFFIDGMLKDRKPNRILTEATTGYGKTYMATYVVSQLSLGTLIYLKATYISKWIKDLNEYFELEDGDIFIIKGSDSFCKLYNLEIKPKFVIISSSTFHNYLEYHTNVIVDDEDPYCIAPDKFMEKMNLRVFLTDETHKSFNNIYRAILALDPPKIISLTATLITKDSSLSSFHYSLFPSDNRLDLSSYRVFINVVNVAYTIKTNSKINTVTGYGYNHKQYEKFILTRKVLRESYIKMLIHYLDSNYIDGKQSGDRALVFASSLDMINFITDRLKSHYKDLDIRTYIGKDKYENALEPDIRVSHPQSLAEAVDIDGLTYTLNTVNIDSIATYIQMIGRLRFINGRDLVFTQLYSTNITSHKKYIDGNKRFIRPRVLTIEDDKYSLDLDIY